MKLKKTCLLLALLACFPIAACDGAASSSSSSSSSSSEEVNTNPYATSQNLFENGYYFLGDFESFEQCVQFSLGGGMKAEQCFNADLVTHGESSMKVTIEHGNAGWSSPRGGASTGFSCTGGYFQKTNFKDCDWFEFDIYNGQDFAVTVFIDVVPLWACGYAFSLQPGWNTITLEGWRCNYTYKGTTSTPESVDESQNFLGEINSFSIKFPSYETYNEPQVYYLDRFVAHKIAE